MTGATLDDLRTIGADISERRRSRATTEDLRRDLLRHLVDYPPMSFGFARFKDEIVDTVIDDMSYECFGRCSYGVFLIATDRSVWLRSVDPTYTDDLEWLYCNADLFAFIKAYSSFIASVFHVKAHFDAAGREAGAQAAAFTEAICTIEGRSAETTSFWTFMAAMLEENEVSISWAMVHYMRADRFLVADASMDSRVIEDEARLTDL